MHGVIFSIGYFSFLIWVFITGIIMVIKAIVLFKKRNVLLGIMILSAGLAMSFFARYIVSIIFIIIYGTR
jgi:hypothetical protein